jgi:non-ribosomal peptide synthetase component F/acyl carrier protein
MKSPLIYDKAMHEARKYWRDRLDAMSFAGHIALDHPRPQDGRQQLASLVRPLDPDVHALLRRLSGGNPFLAYTALVSALKICCHQYSGERVVTIFSPATSEGAVASLLPISSTLDGNAAFKEVLLATKDLLSCAFREQQYPFSRMLLDLPEERRPRQLPMIAAMAGFNQEIPETPCDITVLFDTTEGRTEAAFRFDARVHDESTVLCFFQWLSGVLKRGLGDPATRIVDLRPEQAPEGTGSAAPPIEGVDPHPQDLCLHRLIEGQAASHPARVAVVEGGRATTYGALDRDAESLAERLAGLALDVRKPIVILMDAGTEMIVSMLAVLKAGAAFAPIKLLSTSGGPVGSVLDGLDSQCIICQPEHLADLLQLTAGLTGVQSVVTVEYAAPAGDEDGSSFRIACQGGPARIVPAPGSAPANPRDDGARGFGTACVLVGGHDGGRSRSWVSHAELVSLFQWLNSRGGIGGGDRCLLSPGLGAGEQLYDTLGLLSAGGSVEITDAEGLTHNTLLAERLLAPSITVWDLPTALAQNLLATLTALHAERPHLAGPRNIFLSGEKQCANLAEKLAQCFPAARITGLYASPAVGIWSTFFPLCEDPAAARRAVTAQAIAGFEHQVLHGSGELAPFHTKGELHLRRSFSAASSAQKTGLRAQARDDGRVTWLRGEDHCFDKYGCTVELTEVEAALCHHQDIRAAEILAVKPEPGASRAVVAFVLADPAQLSAAAAADHLVLRGDVDLIPDRFILLDEFPLTAGGAIDRDALSARFVSSREQEGDSRSGAVDHIHRKLKSIWLDILQVDDVADDDSFFARGGNSLKATLLIVRIRDEFLVDLSVQKFFREPSTRAVAQLIAAESANAANLKKEPDFRIVPRERYRMQLPELE